MTMHSRRLPADLQYVTTIPRSTNRMRVQTVGFDDATGRYTFGGVALVGQSVTTRRTSFIGTLDNVSDTKRDAIRRLLEAKPVFVDPNADAKREASKERARTRRAAEKLALAPTFAV